MLTDPDGSILLINEAGRTFLDPETSFLKNIKEAFTGMQMKPKFQEVLSSPQNIVNFELTREKPKKLVLDGSASRLFMQKKDGQSREMEGWLWVFRDVTVQRMEEGMVRNFLSLISHKLKTPLASINGYAQILLEDAKAGKLSEFSSKAVSTVNQQGAKLADLVERLLGYVTIEELNSESLKKSQFDVNTVAKETISSLSERYKDAKVKFEFADAGAPLLVMGDSRLWPGSTSAWRRRVWSVPGPGWRPGPALPMRPL